MVFTPLLASTCVGTLDFQSVAESVSRLQPALATAPNSYFYLAYCKGVDLDKHEIYCKTVSNSGLPQEPYRFKVAYDKLVIAAGAEPLTFNINEVKEYAYFLREVNHAQEIRKRFLLNLMLSENPTCEGFGSQLCTIPIIVALITYTHIILRHAWIHEAGLSVRANEGFSSSRLDVVVLDLVADDGAGMQKQKSVYHWDKRNKKYIKLNNGYDLVTKFLVMHVSQSCFRHRSYCQFLLIYSSFEI
ncbi:hypothetical protein GIB67_004667 [Kingdonia uniflora]|uniref:Uncharacterized protein n=1 Tax=Kingdonia uniflora TaxID=39325 RepID=A0A7J7P577_9MAGN|nr:hypothetical protein GIB67_004667 [Kingdonia uniflora]